MRGVPVLARNVHREPIIHPNEFSPGLAECPSDDADKLLLHERVQSIVQKSL